MWIDLQNQYDLRIAQRVPSRATVAAMAQLDAGKGEGSTASTSDVLDRAVRGRSSNKR